MYQVALFLTIEATLYATCSRCVRGRRRPRSKDIVAVSEKVIATIVFSSGALGWRVHMSRSTHAHLVTTAQTTNLAC